MQLGKWALLRQAKWKGRVLSRKGIEQVRRWTNSDCCCQPVRVGERSILGQFLGSMIADMCPYGNVVVHSLSNDDSGEWFAVLSNCSSPTFLVRINR